MTPRSGEELNELEARQEPRLVKALEMVAPGTAVREGIDNIVNAHTGGLIVIGDPDELSFLFSGGIKLDIDYTPALLYQLAKMDGAIALNGNATRIAWCNVQLMPDPTILSSETGTRHRTAERVSKQTDALVIAVSQRRDVVSLYVDGGKYILEEIPGVLARPNQALAPLDKYRSRLDQVSTRLTALEFEGGVTLHDVLTVLQRSELVTRMAVEIERYIADLEVERDAAQTTYEVGDHVVYPHHGAGKVLRKEVKEVLGEKREYLTIKILHNDMTVMVPCENAGRAGLRRVIDDEAVQKVLGVLRDDVSSMPKNWNRRFKHNREKIKTGDVYELAEVVRNLAIREADKGLSTGEKQMYTRAKKILASELMYALDMEEDEAEGHLDSLISDAHAERNGAPAAAG